MDFESLMTAAADLQTVAQTLNWPLWVWLVLSGIFLLSIAVCIREFVQFVLGIHSLRREVRNFTTRLAEMEQTQADLKERLSLLEAGVDDFDEDSAEARHQFEISH